MFMSLPFCARRFSAAVVTLGVVLLLSACASRSRAPAPVDDRSTGGRGTTAPAPAPTTAPGVVTTGPSTTTPGAPESNAGKPGYYSVKPGDTLIRIGLDVGQNWRDLARWNNLTNPNALEVGQVLRVVPPESAAVAQPVTSGAVVHNPAPGAPTSAATTPAPPAPIPNTTNTTGATPSAGASPTASPTVRPAPGAVSASPTPAPTTDEITWAWPSPGAVLSPFDESKNKGLALGGKAGDPVLAAADGRVVYAGTGLRGYGNLVIVKHNNTYLSAYAHNQALMVSENQAVRQGQKIAEMGSTDADRVKLHFEIRRQGKPVDPAKYLPPR